MIWERMDLVMQKILNNDSKSNVFLEKIRIERYNEKFLEDWNDFLGFSKNGTFLFHRSYMDYHADRFIDHSLLIYLETSLIALLPANEKDSSINSHGGLTYGGLIFTTQLKAAEVIDVLNAVCDYYKVLGYTQINYKSVPDIYCNYPSGEDKYALFIRRAKLFRRDLSTTILLENPQKLSKGRKWLLTKARKQTFSVIESIDFNLFFNSYNAHLVDRYSVSAVHTAEEMSTLKKSFPQNIKLLTTVNEFGDFLGGMIIYITSRVIHAQYIHFTQIGKELGAFEFLMDELFNSFNNHKYFDFGISP